VSDISFEFINIGAVRGNSCLFTFVDHRTYFARQFEKNYLKSGKKEVKVLFYPMLPDIRRKKTAIFEGGKVAGSITDGVIRVFH
jgi:hypothetical protein